MKKLYWAFLTVVILGVGLVVVYFGLKPSPLVKINTRIFESSQALGQAVADNLKGELHGVPVLVLGLMEPARPSVKVWEEVLKASQMHASEKRRFMLPDFYREELAPLPAEVFGEVSFVASESFLEAIKAALREDIQVISLLPTPLASRLGPNQQITGLQADIKGQVMTLSLAPLALTRAGLARLPDCQKEPSPSSAVTDLACAIQYKSRFTVRKGFPEDKIVGTLEKYGASEYLLFLYQPSVPLSY